MSDGWRLPLGDWVDAFVALLISRFRGFFRYASTWIGSFIGLVENVLQTLPFWFIILAFVLLAYRLAGRGIAIFATLGLFLIWSLGLWERAMITLALVITATLVSMVIGIPIGIVTARSRKVDVVLRPVLDLMQTMPSFVYLIPALMFFGIGRVPGVVATVVFSMPPAIRLTSLGIRQVPDHLIDASRSFGATPAQTLFGVQLPLALPTIMTGINQTIMLSLSMVVVAAMIGAGGLGGVVLTAIQRVQIGSGFEGGLAIVVFAIILDRTTQALASRTRRAKGSSRGWRWLTTSMVGAAALILLVNTPGGTAPRTQPVRIAMPPWTTSPPPTFIAKVMIEDMLGTPVEIEEADIGVAFQALATQDIDLMLDGWMPHLHANYFETYGDELDLLGVPLYSGTELGWGVPAYVPVDSVTQLNNHVEQFEGRVIGIDPGASMMRVSQEIIDTYDLNYELVEGSEFAMLTALNDAIQTNDWIVFLAWRPHFMFTQHDLKVLDEPKGLWTQDQVVKVTRLGFADDYPKVARLLSQWEIDLADVERMIYEIEVAERAPETVAREWVEANESRIREWLEEIE